jgi:hypothetical protein
MVLKRPSGLERLADYAEASPVPVLFAEAVGSVWPKVRADISAQREEPERFYRGIADRIFRSQHPFRSELAADYAIYVGMAIALAKRMGELADPETIIWGINYPKTYEQHELRGSIYPIWGHATLCELMAQPRYYPFMQDPIGSTLHKLKVKTGFSPNEAQLEAARLFVDDYYKDPSHTRDLLFTAGKV